MLTTDPTKPNSADLSPWLQDCSFGQYREQFDRDGYLIFEDVLGPTQLTAIHQALEPYFDQNLTGRNDFEGLKTNRVYGLLGKSPVFGDLSAHPLPLAFAEADLGSACLLSACLAINLQPGESSQPWHQDDAHIDLPMPRPSWGVSAFWAIDETTPENGATEILPGSHLWSDEPFAGQLQDSDFANNQIREPNEDPGAHPQALQVPLKAGSLMLTKGSLWHRGAANKSNSARLIVTPQYCPGWARQLENMMAVVPTELVATYPKRVRELIGYSIHPPFMGYVDGVHPQKLLQSVSTSTDSSDHRNAVLSS